MLCETNESDLLDEDDGFHNEELTLNMLSDTDKHVVPEYSKEKYSATYNMFKAWCIEKGLDSVTEHVLMMYFNEMSKKYKPTTLWTRYSILKAMLIMERQINIATYVKLKAFLKRQASGFKSKKSKIFTSQEITKFLNEAPDRHFLLAKVVLIMGITGACRREELYEMKVADVKDLNSAVLVELHNKRTKSSRKFAITGEFYDTFKKYANLRPVNVNDPHFFLNYQNGKCMYQRVGINKLGGMGKTIAIYLKLPEPEGYTGLCFRRSATIRVHSPEDLTTFKRFGYWSSTAVVEDATDESSQNKNGENITNEDDDSDSMQQDLDDATFDEEINDECNLKNESNDGSLASTSFPNRQNDSESRLDEQDADKCFLLSLLPDVRRLDEDEMLDFRLHCLQFFSGLRQTANMKSASHTSTSSTSQFREIPNTRITFPKTEKFLGDKLQVACIDSPKDCPASEIKIELE